MAFACIGWDVWFHSSCTCSTTHTNRSVHEHCTLHCPLMCPCKKLHPSSASWMRTLDLTVLPWTCVGDSPKIPLIITCIIRGLVLLSRETSWSPAALLSSPVQPATDYRGRVSCTQAKVQPFGHTEAKSLPLTHAHFANKCSCAAAPLPPLNTWNI